MTAVAVRTGTAYRAPYTRALDINPYEGLVCAGVDPEVFYPDPTDERGKRLAKRLCRSCPARKRCLEDELAVPQAKDIAGIFGGMDEDERRAERQRRARAERRQRAS